MIDVDEAQRILLDNVSVGMTETIPLRDALHRTLAEPVRSDVDFPPFDRSVMDGYAVRAQDTQDAPTSLEVIGQIAAGSSAAMRIGKGQAMQINTGAPIPDGSDAVVRVEATQTGNDPNQVIVETRVASGMFITKKARYVTEHQIVIPAGTRLSALEISAAAAAGAPQVTVYGQPGIAILVSGDELVEIDQKPGDAQIRDSNRYLLEALIRSSHARPRLLGVASDDKQDLRRKIEQGLSADMLCITGGISMGEFDFVPEVLLACGADIRIHKMAIKPGRPTIFAVGPHGTPIFALSGNPGSALIGFELLVRPAIDAWQNREPDASRLTLVELRGSIPTTRDRRTYYPGVSHTEPDGSEAVIPLPWNGSGDTFGWVTANALIMRPPGAPEVPDSGMVEMMRLNHA